MTCCVHPQSHVKPLEHSAEAEELLLRFLGRVLQWLRTNHARVVNLFRKFDSDHDNMLTAEDFFIGMRMMDVSIANSDMQALGSIAKVQCLG